MLPDDDEPFTYLTLNLNMGIPFDIFEPDDVTIRIHGDIAMEVEDSDETTAVGTLEAFLVPLSSVDHYGFSLFDVLDADTDTSFYTGILRSDPDEHGLIQWNLLAQALHEEAFLGTDLLIVDCVEIKEQFRGKRLGLLAVRRLIDALGDGMALVVIRPFPLQFIEYQSPDWIAPAGVTDRDKAFSEARERLATYWGVMGFRGVGEGLMALNPGLITPTIDELKTADLHPRKLRAPERMHHGRGCRNAAKSRRQL